MKKKFFLLVICAGLFVHGCAKKEESNLDKFNQFVLLNSLLSRTNTSSSSFPANFTCMISGSSSVFVNESITSWKFSNSIRTTSSSLSTIYSIAYLNNRWYVTGNNGIGYSSDGNNWTLNSLSGINLRSIGYSGSKYIAVGNKGALTTSTNGTDWSNFILGTLSNGKNILSVAYGSNIWTFGGSLTAPEYPSPINYSNNDGTSWTDSDFAAGTTINNIIFANSQFVSVGTAGSIATSSNGSSWTVRTSSTANDLSSIAYGNSIYVAVGASGTVVYSPDGITWQLGASGETVSLSSVAYDASAQKFYALSQRSNTCNCGSGKNPAILSSSNGSTWTIELENSSTFDGQYADIIACKP